MLYLTLTVIAHLYGLSDFFVTSKEVLKCAYIHLSCKIIRPKEIHIYKPRTQHKKEKH